MSKQVTDLQQLLEQEKARGSALAKQQEEQL